MSNEEEYYEEGEGDEEYYEEEEGGDNADEIQKRMNEMEDELNKLNQLQSSVEKKIGNVADSVDEHSIYIGQVDYEATIDELRAHFAPCGSIDKIAIICDHRGNSKGYAYIAFVDKESVANALKLDDTPFKGRQLKVLPKRHNIPAAALRGGRGGGFRGRGGKLLLLYHYHYYHHHYYHHYYYQEDEDSEAVVEDSEAVVEDSEAVDRALEEGVVEVIILLIINQLFI